MFAPQLCRYNVPYKLFFKRPILRTYLQLPFKIYLVMREQNVSTNSKNPQTPTESENKLAAVIAVVSLIILLACVFK